MDYYLVAFLAFISYALYKCYIHPFYLSPLRKIPGPPLDSFILGHYATFLNKEIGIIQRILKVGLFTELKLVCPVFLYRALS